MSGFISATFEKQKNAILVKKVDKILSSTGAFWQHESYDHVVRDGKKLERVVLNILVKGLYGSAGNLPDFFYSF